MTTSEWHVEPVVWTAYAEGRLDVAAEASVDTHVATCASCRDAAGALVDPAEVTSLWHAIRADVARPELPRTLRWLRRLGVPGHDLVVLAASDGLALPWATAVGGATVCALLTGLLPSRQEEVFLLLAPLIPVLAVVAAFDATDRLRALAATTPYSPLRLALLRTTATLLIALPVTLAVGLGIPGLEPLAATWLLPALALTSTTLVLHTRFGSTTSSAVVAAGWTVAVVTTARLDDVAAISHLTAQLGFLVVLLAMSSLLVVRTTAYHVPGGDT